MKPLIGIGLTTTLAALLAAALLAPAPALAQAGSAPKGNPALSALNIEVWPEYDRPAVLVILKGALAESVKLPAAVTLRLPASSGGPAAVAYSSAADGNLLNLKHDVTRAGDYVTVKFEATERFFHIEFYEPIATTAPERSFRYVWPGDLAVERATVVVQEPVAATAISVEPNLDRSSLGQDGMKYRIGEPGALPAGKTLPIVVRYTKADARPSRAILNPAASSGAAAASAPAAIPAAMPAPAAGGLPDWAIPLAGFALLGAIGAGLIAWIWRRGPAPAPAAPAGKHCVKCGAALAADDRFCGKCGRKVA